MISGLPSMIMANFEETETLPNVVKAENSGSFLYINYFLECIQGVAFSYK